MNQTPEAVEKMEAAAASLTHYFDGALEGKFKFSLHPQILKAEDGKAHVGLGFKCSIAPFEAPRQAELALQYAFSHHPALQSEPYTLSVCHHKGYITGLNILSGEMSAEHADTLVAELAKPVTQADIDNGKRANRTLGDTITQALNSVRQHGR